jgi:hypothetical protein
MTTWGDIVPRMRSLPGYEAMAASPYPGPVGPTGNAPVRLRPAARPIVPFPDAGPDGGKPRVGLWAPVLFDAGAEVWMLALARCLADRVSWRGLAVENPNSVSPGMRARFEALMPVGFGREACRSLAGECDVVVSWAMASVPGLLEGVARRPKVVNVCHSPVESEWGMSSYRDPAGVDAYVAVSELALGPICESRRADAKVIRNCVDPSRLVVDRPRAAMRAKWGIPAGAKVVGHYGRLAPEKDPGALVRMAPFLPDGWHVAILGEGHMRTALDRAKWERGLDRVHFLGPDPAAGDVLNALDVLVVASEYESFGLTLAEGLWMGLPVVSTSVGIARLRPGLTYEVPSWPDGETLARTVVEAFEDGPKLGASEWALANLSPDRFAREWMALIESLAARPKEPSLLRKAANLTRAVVGHVANGMKRPMLEAQADRKRICEACPNLDRETSKCLVCGCSNMDAKRAMASERCPEGKWDAV